MSRIDPIKEAQAVTAIRETLAALGEEADMVLLIDTVEGETGFFETIDTIMGVIADDQAMIEAVKAQESNLKARRDRFAKRVEFNKALIEQAWIVADLPKVERPLGTLYLSSRGPKVIIETESDIPTKYWKAADPVLDQKLLGDDLKDRRTAFDAIIATSDEAREVAIQAFHQRFLMDDLAAVFRERIEALDAIEDDQAHDRALADLRRDFTNLPGATLSNGSRSLSIRTA